MALDDGDKEEKQERGWSLWDLLASRVGRLTQEWGSKGMAGTVESAAGSQELRLTRNPSFPATLTAPPPSLGREITFPHLHGVVMREDCEHKAESRSRWK